MAERSLQHRESDSKDDETLRREARAHLASEPALQLVAELIARLRDLDMPWWTPVKLRERWGAVERMSWFRERSDVRQQITTSLSGLSPRAARRKTPDFQGSLIDSVIDEGDITPRAFEAAFDPRDLAVYGPAGAYWHFFRESMPWDQNTAGHQEIVAWLLRSLLADRSPFEGIGRTPILTPWDVRTAIDGRLWQTRIPLEIRVAIDSARLQHERDRPDVPFHADGELAIAGPEIIAANIPPREILPVVLLAQTAMRFDTPRVAQSAEHARPASQESTSRPRDAGHAGTHPAAMPATVSAPSEGGGSSGKTGSGGAAPAAPPASSPAAPPVSSPAAPPVSSPAAPPVSSPAAPPVSSPAAPPVSSPAAPPVSSPAAPPVSSPAAPPVSSPAAPPVSSPAAPPAASVSAPPGAAHAGRVSPSGTPSAGLRLTGSVPPPSAAHAPVQSSSAASKSASEGSVPPPPGEPVRSASRPEHVTPARASAPLGRSASPASGAAHRAGLNSIDVEEDVEQTNPWVVPTPAEISEGMAIPGSPDARKLRGKS